MTVKTPRKHGNTGNQHASKGHDSILTARVPTQSKAGWVQAAQREGKTLTDWVIEKLDNTGEYRRNE